MAQLGPVPISHPTSGQMKGYSAHWPWKFRKEVKTGGDGQESLSWVAVPDPLAVHLVALPLALSQSLCESELPYL